MCRPQPVARDVPRSPQDSGCNPTVYDPSRSRTFSPEAAASGAEAAHVADQARTKLPRRVSTYLSTVTALPRHPGVRLTRVQRACEATDGQRHRRVAP